MHILKCRVVMIYINVYQGPCSYSRNGDGKNDIMTRPENNALTRGTLSRRSAALGR
jgi:hypothetical protein